MAVVLLLCAIAVAVMQPLIASAQTPTSIDVGTILRTEGQQGQPQDIGTFLVWAVNVLALTIGSFAFLAIVIGGIVLLTSAGDDSSLQKGKDIIKYAIIGLVVALAAFFIVAFVQSVFFEFEGANLRNTGDVDLDDISNP